MTPPLVPPGPKHLKFKLLASGLDSLKVRVMGSPTIIRKPFTRVLLSTTYDLRISQRTFLNEVTVLLLSSGCI